MITILPLLVFCVAVASGNPAVGSPWHWKSPKPLVTPIGPVKSSRIVGGNEATAHSYPHQVALFIDNTYLCGGALISDEWVLTAAHCMENANFVDVLMGAHDIKIFEDTQVTMTSTDFFVHEDWISFSLTNDIAVIRLPTPVTLNAYIQSIGLPATDVSEGAVVTATGWGKTSDSSSTSAVLREVDVNVISNAYCNGVYLLITGGNICTDGTGGKGTCDGDSGGPLTKDDKTYGIASFESTEGCLSGYPDVFTRVYHYLNWIEQMTGITP